MPHSTAHATFNAVNITKKLEHNKLKPIEQHVFKQICMYSTIYCSSTKKSEFSFCEIEEDFNEWWPQLP